MTGRYDCGESKLKKSEFPLFFTNIDANAVRIRTAKVLLIGIQGLGNEVAKNLVLAGIGGLTIVDDQTVTEDDLGAQFLISEKHVGMNASLTYPYETFLTLLACSSCLTPSPGTQS